MPPAKGGGLADLAAAIAVGALNNTAFGIPVKPLVNFTGAAARLALQSLALG